MFLGSLTTYPTGIGVRLNLKSEYPPHNHFSASQQIYALPPPIYHVYRVTGSKLCMRLHLVHNLSFSSHSKGDKHPLISQLEHTH
ncbi:hypothetical protein Lal_00011261 [Lupinus albus]|nr:hypothetical protein Lal_00011261 [Lupinus albus]